jgi:hypothetical protein
MNSVALSCEDSLELRLDQTAQGWRVSTTIAPAEPQFDDFTTRREAVQFLGHIVAESTLRSADELREGTS